MPTEPEMSPTGTEIIIGLVAALGTDLDGLTKTLVDELETIDYSYTLVHLSKCIKEIARWRAIESTPLDQYIEAHQTAGDELRSAVELGDALARVAVSKIRDIRDEKGGEAGRVIPRHAYILRQLKHPDEIKLLRSIYGSSFFLVAAYSPREARLEKLSSDIASSHNSFDPYKFRDRAEALIKRDEEETDNHYGQNVRHSFPEADVFIDMSDGARCRSAVKRFIELIFGYPFHTPTASEFAMFHAQAAALRSSDLARQVGAVIASNDGDVIAVGSNEVPKSGGGLYWSETSPDGRDFVLGRDRGREMRRTTLSDILVRLKNSGWLSPEKTRVTSEQLIEEALPLMKNSRLMAIGEFGRTVHAEMAAILDAARRGVAIQGQTLYSTTFPCHNCARHIVGSGIGRVVYIEPYPKSLASFLHADSIVIEGSNLSSGKVVFVPFVGIAPRKYLELFSMPKRRGEDGNPIQWKKYGAVPRLASPNAHLSYVDLEVSAIRTLNRKLDAAGLAKVD